jgi:hypothetical protein
MLAAPGGWDDALSEGYASASKANITDAEPSRNSRLS